MDRLRDGIVHYPLVLWYLSKFHDFSQVLLNILQRFVTVRKQYILRVNYSFEKLTLPLET